jgi:hypothetical protein
MKIARFEEFQISYDHCKSVRKIIDGLIRYLKKHLTGQRATGSTG